MPTQLFTLWEQVSKSSKGIIKHAIRYPVQSLKNTDLLKLNELSNAKILKRLTSDRYCKSI